MPVRPIKMLHVEDEESQRRLVAHHLQAFDDLGFEITYADSEEAALESFRAGGVAFVIVDYNLRQGNGLHCLEEMRLEDPIVPIIAISGVASDEIAAELLQAGADDFISKRDLTSGLLVQRMRGALTRADACRRWSIDHPD